MVIQPIIFYTSLIFYLLTQNVTCKLYLKDIFIVNMGEAALKSYPKKMLLTKKQLNIRNV